MTNLTSKQTVITVTSQAVACEIAGETVLLDMPSGRYFALNPIGTVIWQWLSTPCHIESLCERLLQEYDVTAERCEAEVTELIRQLAEHGLVRLDECGA